MGCEYIENCELRKITNRVKYEGGLKEYESEYCYGDEFAVKECPHRKILKKVEKLERHKKTLGHEILRISMQYNDLFLIALAEKTTDGNENEIPRREALSSLADLTKGSLIENMELNLKFPRDAA